MTARHVADAERYHVILTLWEDEHSRQAGYALLRACTGVATVDGGHVRVSHGGQVYAYPRLLTDMELTELFSVTPTSQAISLPWWRDTPPAGVRWSSVVGELSLIDEVDGGLEPSAWVDRRVVVAGRVSGVTWGDASDMVSFQLDAAIDPDRGDWYATGAEIGTTQFPDVGSSDERSRARNSEGLLPALAWAPVGSQMEVPLLCVVDEVSANGTDDLVPRRWLVGYERPGGVGEEYRVRMVHPDRAPSILTSPDSTSFRVDLAEDTDAEGVTYYYLPGDWRVPFGTASCHWINGHDHLTATRQGGRVGVGWQVRNPTDTDADWIEVISRDGSDVELGYDGTAANYTGATASNVDGISIPLPVDGADAVYYVAEWGGLVGSSDVPASSIVDVLIGWCGRAVLNMPICTGDLEALRPLLTGVDVEWFTVQRGSPWERVLAVLDVLPVRVYVSQGQYRFRWTGGYRWQDVAAVLEVGIGGVRSAGGVSVLEGDIYPVIELSSRWSHRLQRYQTVSTADGSIGYQVPVAGEDVNLQSQPRCASAYREWRSANRSVVTPPVLRVELDWIQSQTSRGIVTGWLAYRYTAQAMAMELEMPASWRWLEVGDLVAVRWSDVVELAVWRIEARTLDTAGMMRVSLQSVECSPGDAALTVMGGGELGDRDLWGLP